MKDSISIRSILLQYRAECSQGLNELNGRGTAEDQAEAQLLQLLESKAEELAMVKEKEPKLYVFVSIKAIPLSAINELRSK